MADDRRRSSGFGFKFFLFLVYVAAYGFLRYQGEITVQQIPLSTPGGGTEIFRVIGANMHLPHWRQQTWRAVFSLAMVCEEEGVKIMNQGMSTYRGARAPGGQPYGGQGGQTMYSGGQSYGGQNMYSGGQQQQQVVYSSAPTYSAGGGQQQQYQQQYQQQQYRQPQQPQQRQNAYAAPAPQNTANPGERVVWDGRNQSVQELPAGVRRPLSAVSDLTSKNNAPEEKNADAGEPSTETKKNLAPEEKTAN